VTSTSGPILDDVKSLVTFLPVVTVLVLVPGANNLVVVRETIAAGPRGGRLATAGTSLGILVWALAVAAGLGVLLQANPRVWVALQLVGGAALVGLGVQSVLRTTTSTAADRRPGAGSFVPALLTALLNPRAGIVAVSLLPQFVGPGQDPAATTLALGLAWASVAGAWNRVGVQLVDRSRGWFAGRRGRRTTDLVSGAFLVAIGVSSGWAAL
jgi:threonine/homoserine/homoserine lactone efflux protein